MTRYEYAITVYEAEDILEAVSAPVAQGAPPMVYCDTEGECFFDEAPNPYLAAIVETFNTQGEAGWALVQVVPRQQDMICFWRRERS
jgi:hypothetical protein